MDHPPDHFLPKTHPNATILSTKIAQLLSSRAPQALEPTIVPSSPRNHDVTRPPLSDPSLVNRWNEVSRSFYERSGRALYRSGKQCREQWFNHLDSSKKQYISIDPAESGHPKRTKSYYNLWLSTATGGRSSAERPYPPAPNT